MNQVDANVVPKFGLGVCLLLAGIVSSRAQPPIQEASASQATAASNAQGQAAVDLVVKQYTINPMVKVAATGKPLAKDGSWGVRQALPNERVAGCEAEGVTCREVVYHAGQPEILCTWTVFFPAGEGPAKIVNENDATARFLLRTFVANDPDAPVKLKGPAPEMPPIAKLAHLSGDVVLRVKVDASGKVQGSSVIRTANPVFNNYAMHAVDSWEMEPFLVNGQARPFAEILSLHFE